MRWVLVTDHPRRPSPYFSQLAAAAAAEGFGIEFSPDVVSLSGPPGVVNLHRLKRLYRSSGGATTAAALRLAGTLARLKREGWRVVWTLHNLYPIDVRRRRLADLIAVRAAARMADAVVCHTHVDAGEMRRRVRRDAAVVVAGWGGLLTDPAAAVAPDVERIARRMEADRWSFLLFGNLAPYKDVPGTVRAFLHSGVVGRLHVVGPAGVSFEPSLRRFASEKVVFSIGRVDPADAWRLYAAARAAVCPYRAAGAQRFFRRAIFAGSVATAIAFDVPVVAPRLPSVVEMIGDRPAAIYENARDMARAFEAAAGLADTRGRRRPETGGRRWREVVRRYAVLARQLSADAGVVPA